jgi:hypothetical protein
MLGNYYIIFEGDFLMFVAFTFDQWCISDEYKTFSNQSCHNIFC